MINLSHRSYQKELMDADNIPFPAIAQTLKELNTVNTLLGGHATTLKGMEYFVKDKTPVTVCEIGCGGGDNLSAIYKYCCKRDVPVDFIGIDKNPECIAFAMQQYPELPCEWICSDYATVKFPTQPAIIFSSLFCHHFTDEELIKMLQWLRFYSERGFFINDLHRHWLAYYLIKYLTHLFSRSYLVKNDASISVARGFIKPDWKRMFREAGLYGYSIRWRWAFRFLITYKKEISDAAI